MATGLTIERKLFFTTGKTGTRLATAEPPVTPPPGRVPRVSRLMALAIKFDGLVKSGAVKDYAELARLGKVTRARMTQVMNLLMLAPDLQEQLLFLPKTLSGRDPIKLLDLQPVAAELNWRRQRARWAAVVATARSS